MPSDEDRWAYYRTTRDRIPASACCEKVSMASSKCSRRAMRREKPGAVTPEENLQIVDATRFNFPEADFWPGTTSVLTVIRQVVKPANIVLFWEGSARATCART